LWLLLLPTFGITLPGADDDEDSDEDGEPSRPYDHEPDPGVHDPDLPGEQ